MNAIELIDRAAQQTLLEQAAQSERRRAHRLFHDGPADPVQRMLIGILPDSYVPPHRHPAEDKWEWVQMVSGAIDVLLFDEGGRLHGRHSLEADGAVTGLQLAPNQWHSLVAVQPSVFLELKPGPFVAETAADFAPWAPQESAASKSQVLKRLRHVKMGERLNAS